MSTQTGVIRLPNIVTLIQLLDFHCGGQGRNYARDSRAWSDANKFLYSNDLIAESQTHVMTTPKGAAFVRHLMAQPLPISFTEWRIPDVEKLEG